MCITSHTIKRAKTCLLKNKGVDSIGEENMRRKLYLNLLLIFLVAACAGTDMETEPDLIPTSAIIEFGETVTAVLVTVEEMEVDLKEARSRLHYLPFEDCLPTRLYNGDYAYLTGGDTSVRIRIYPDVHVSDSILAYASDKELVHIVGGPYCSYEWILWKVETSSGIYGWISESDGDWFWLSPVDGPPSLPDELKNDATKLALFTKTSEVMQDPNLSDTEKRDRVALLEKEFGKPNVIAMMQYTPVYNANHKRLESFESYWRTFASTYEQTTSDSIMETDPLTASYEIFMNPTEDTVMKMLTGP